MPVARPTSTKGQAERSQTNRVKDAEQQADIELTSHEPRQGLVDQRNCSRIVVAFTRQPAVDGRANLS